MKTAVEWLQHKMATSTPEDIVNNINEWFDKAKAMERMQREKDFVCGYKTRALGSNLIFDETSEMYAIKLFKEIFKSE